MELQDAKELALQHMKTHGLLELGWSLHFFKASTTFGQCRYNSRMICLSKPLTFLNGIEEVENTILHEIAHALVGPGHYHDQVWKFKAQELGATPVACYDAKKVAPHAPWYQYCPRCKKRFPKARKHVRTQSCGACGKEVYSDHKFHADLTLLWEPNPEQMTPFVRPQSGVGKEVWDMADTITMLQGGVIPPKKKVVQACVELGINKITAQVQYGKWLKAQYEDNKAG